MSTNRNILVLGASTHQLPAIQTALNLGLTVHVADNQPYNPGHSLADSSHIVDTTDIPAIKRLAKSLELSAIISPCTDVAVKTAAEVASAFGLPGVSIEAAQILTSKLSFRKFQKHNGIEHPGFCEVTLGSQDLNKVDFNHGIIKPDRSSGSKGIVITSNQADDFEKYIGEASNVSINSKVIFEELLIGDQLTAEGVLLDGKVELSFILDRDTAEPPYVCTYGHSWPSKTFSESNQEVIRAIEVIFQKLGIRDTVFDADIIMHDQKAYILEASPRLGGNSISKLVKLACDIDFPKIALEIALGQKPSMTMVEPVRHSSLVLLGVMQSGNVEIEKNLLERIHQLKWVNDVDIYVNNGDPVDPFINGRHCLAAVFLNAPDRKTLEERRREIKHSKLFQLNEARGR